MSTFPIPTDAMGITFLKGIRDQSHEATQRVQSLQSLREKYYQMFAGKRDSVVLASKTLKRGSEDAMGHLENSLRMLKTDHLDLWQVHQILPDAEADSIFIPSGGTKGAADFFLGEDFLAGLGVTPVAVAVEDIRRRLAGAGDVTHAGLCGSAG